MAKSLTIILYIYLLLFLFDYYIDISGWNAKLYYPIPNGNGQLVIKISGGTIYIPTGERVNTLAMVNRKVLESKELAEILDFSIRKN